MIKLYNSKETNFEHNGLGVLKDATNSIVTEEQNGMFELEFTYRVGSFLFNKLDYDMIAKADASPNLKAQLFRIYYISKEILGTVLVKAQHISYDLFDNFVEKLDLTNVTCEYALNQIFKSCIEKNSFIGYSDIENSQNYSTECINPYNAIKGTRGSIIDTFGNGAKIKRDNFNIHVLNNRGESNNVLIAYKKNIKGLEASQDVQDVVTKIYPYAMIDEESQEGENTSTKQVKITLPEKYIESENIDKYAKQKILAVDFSDETIKTVEQLRAEAKNYFNNKKDLPLSNYKVDFIELSKTENYKNYKLLEDVDLDDEVIVRDLRLGINATTRVVKTQYNPIAKRYIGIELGQLINHWKNDDDRFDKIEEDIGNIKDDINNIDPSVDDTKFPDSLPDIPIVKSNGLFATIQLEWTYESKTFYNYEIYASQIRDFTPDITEYSNRIYSGKASAFLHEVKPMQTWYYKVRVGNTHGNYTDFSLQINATTRKLSDAAEYFEEAAIEHALIGSLDVDKIVAGKVRGTYIDAKNLTVTDGNGKRTLDIDSFGNVTLDVSSLNIKNQTVLTKEDLKNGNHNLIKNSSALYRIDGWSSFASDLTNIERVDFEIKPPPPKYPPLYTEEQWKEYYDSLNQGNDSNVGSDGTSDGNNVPPPKPPPPSINKDGFVHVLSIDDGLCAFIQDKASGKNILIDSGENYASYNFRTIDYVKSLGIKKIDYIIITHFHSDHAYEMYKFINNFEIGHVYYKEPNWSSMPDKEKPWNTREVYEMTMSAIAKYNIPKSTPTTEGATITLSDTSKIRMWNTTNTNYWDYNNISFGIEYICNNKSVFLGGDMKTDDAEAKLLDKDLKSGCYLVLAHHGYDGSTGVQFLNKVNPINAFVSTYVIDAAKQNTINRVKAKCNLYSTHNNGHIKISITETSISHDAKIKV